MNLRLLNSQLTNVKMHIINTGSTSFAERFMDKTSIETIELVDEANAKSSEKYENNNILIKNSSNRDPTRLNISKQSPHLFTYGTFIKSVEQISVDQVYTFCVFRVGIGKSYSCWKPDIVDKDRHGNVTTRKATLEDIKKDLAAFQSQVPIKDGYDSIYLEDPEPSNIFQMNYVVTSPEQVVLTHII